MTRVALTSVLLDAIRDDAFVSSSLRRVDDVSVLPRLMVEEQESHAASSRQDPRFLLVYTPMHARLARGSVHTEATQNTSCPLCGPCRDGAESSETAWLLPASMMAIKREEKSNSVSKRGIRIMTNDNLLRRHFGNTHGSRLEARGQVVACGGTTADKHADANVLLCARVRVLVSLCTQQMCGTRLRVGRRVLGRVDRRTQ